MRRLPSVGGRFANRPYAHPTQHRPATGLHMFVALLLLTLLTLAPAAAQPDAADAHLAAYFPPTVDLFATVRTDSAFIDQLDALWLRVTGPLPEADITFRETVNAAVQPGGDLNVFTFLENWVGAQAAVGVANLEVLLDADPANDVEATVYAAVDVTNNLAALPALLGTGLLAETTTAQQDGVSVFVGADRAVALRPDVLLIALGTTDLPLNLPTTLADAATFTAALDELPAAAYDLLAYIATPRFVEEVRDDPSVNEALGAFGLPPAALSATGVGVTLLDDNTVAFDIAQVLASDDAPTVAPIDPDFARFIPPDVAVMAQTTDLSNFIFTVSSLRASLSASDTAEAAFARFENLTELLFDLDLRDDILRWTTGNYVAFADFDTAAIAAGGTITPEFGVIIEATDPADAQQVAAALGRAAASILASNTVRVTRESIVLTESSTVLGEIPATTVQFTDAGQPTLTLVIGATDEIFFIATRPTALDFLSQSSGLNTTAGFNEARLHLLSDAHVLLYISGDGVGELATFGYTLLVPGAVDLVPEVLGIGLDTLPTEAQAALAPLFQLVSSSSVSVSASDAGSLLLRLVVTLAS